MPLELNPVNLKPEYMGAPPAQPVNYNPNYRLDHFIQYRDDILSRIPPVHYEWGGMSDVYTPHPDASIYKDRAKHYYNPPSKFTMIDRGRMQEVNDLYVVSQLHRDQYKDDTGVLHPMKYFAKSDYMYQCPTDPTSRYMSYPDYHVKYKQPLVLPVTMGRSLKAPLLPDRALTGVFSPHSDIVWKR